MPVMMQHLSFELQVLGLCVKAHDCQAALRLPVGLQEAGKAPLLFGQLYP